MIIQARFRTWFLSITLLPCLMLAGCVEMSNEIQPADNGLPSPITGCHMAYSDPQILMYGCTEVVMEKRLGPGEEVSEDLFFKNLTGFTVSIWAEPLSSGTLTVRAGGFQGEADILLGKWNSRSSAYDPPDPQNRLRVLIDVCSTDSISVAFEGDGALPAAVDVKVSAHDSGEYFMTNGAGERLLPSCNSNWSHSPLLD